MLVIKSYNSPELFAFCPTRLPVPLYSSTQVQNTEMSDSDTGSLSSAGIPSDDKLEKGLRDAVAEVFKSGNLEELTVKRVRLATEKALGLDDGFFKGDELWKAKSDQIIKKEAVCGY